MIVKTCHALIVVGSVRFRETGEIETSVEMRLGTTEFRLKNDKTLATFRKLSRWALAS
jgi:hypothetical protein